MNYKRLKEVTASELKVGDVWEIYGGKAYVRVTNITTNGFSHIRIHWERVWQNAPETISETGRYTLDPNDIRWLLTNRESDHFPCFDSDCECVYDGIGE